MITTIQKHLQSLGFRTQLKHTISPVDNGYKYIVVHHTVMYSTELTIEDSHLRLCHTEVMHEDFILDGTININHQPIDTKIDLTNPNALSVLEGRLKEIGRLSDLYMRITRPPSENPEYW